MLGVTLWWTSIPIQRGVEILLVTSSYVTGISSGLMGHLACMQTNLECDIRHMHAHALHAYNRTNWTGVVNMTTCAPFLGEAVMYIAGSKNYFLQELMQKSNISHATRKQSLSLRILEKIEIKLMASGRSATKSIAPKTSNRKHCPFLVQG